MKKYGIKRTDGTWIEDFDVEGKWGVQPYTFDINYAYRKWYSFSSYYNLEYFVEEYNE